MAAPAYHIISKDVKNCILDTIEFLDTHVCINNLHWQRGGIIIIFCKYFIVILDTLRGSFLDVLFLLLAVILSELYEKPRRIKIQLQKKVHKRICVRDTTVLTARLSFFLPFVVFFVYSLPLPKWRTCWMVSIKIYNIPTGGVLCDDIMSERSKIWRSLAI